MIVNSNSLNKTIFQCVIFFTIPVFIVFRLFFYQGYIDSPVFFLLINIVKVLFIAYFLVFIYRAKNYSMKIQIPFSVFLSIATLILLYNYNISGPTRNGFASAIEYNAPFLVDYLFYFCLGCGLSIFPTANYKVGMLIFISLILIFVFNIDLKLLRLNINSFVSSSYHTSYIWFSDMIALFVFVYMKDVRNEKHQTIILLILWALSFFLISRTVFFLLTVVFIIHLTLNIVPKIKKSNNLIKISFYIISFSIIAMFLSFLNFDTFTNLSDNRMMKIITVGLSNDSSLNERQAMFYAGLNDIINNPILGSFSGQLTNSSSYWHEERWGAFIHNIFSYYRQFGLVPFVIINFLILYVIILGFKKQIEYRFMFLGVMFFSVEQYFIRSFTSPYIFAFLGYYSHCNLSRHNNEK